ncbi:MAG TPA: hypothetical protein VIN58_12725 [Roseateles sp.]
MGGGDFFGLFAALTPTLALTDLELGYGFTSSGITSYGYATISLDNCRIVPADVHTVPVPATLPLVYAGLLAAGSVRRRGKATG